MKKIGIVLLLAFLLGINLNGFAQDVITKKDGTDISAKILEVTTSEVKYKKFDNLTGPTFSLLKNDILMIRYENGTKDIFGGTSTSTSSSVTSSNTGELCMQAKKDAVRYYTGKNSGAGWVWATTILFSPIIGVIPAAVCSMQPPVDENLKYPTPDLMLDNNYSNCYIDQATQTKRKKIWVSYGISSGVWLIIIILFA